MRALRLTAMVSFLAAACSEDCPRECPRDVQGPTYVEEAHAADHHIGRAVLELLRARAVVRGTADEVLYWPRLEPRIREFMVVLCDKPSIEIRGRRQLDLTSLDLDGYFDHAVLAQASDVECGGLVVEGTTRIGPRFRSD